MRSRTLIPKTLRRLTGAALLCCAAGAALSAPLTEAPRREVQDPHYGDTLFHFYQGRYFTSVVNLMVSQQFERVSHHADEAEVLRGGMLLSYGLHREAGEIFAQLIEKGASPSVQDRAWYYLAKIRYQRGFLPEALDAIGRIGKNLPVDLEEDRVLLNANLLMASGDYAAAAKALAGVNTKDGAGQYARYNLGLALMRSGEAERGSALLDELGKAPAANEEFRSLRDRANVALGFAALQDNRPEGARTYLERVRLTSMHANKALLGFGWAAAAMKEPKLALVPWQELSERDASDAAVLEARIAVPYAYAELGAYGQSLEHYNEAIAAFEQEHTALDESIAAIRGGKLVNGLIERNPGEEMGWFWNIRELPEMPHAAHLTQVLAQHEFQEAFKNYRDLNYLAKNLEQWQDSLGTFGDMLEHRQKTYADRLPKIRAQATEKESRETGLAGLMQRRDALAAELTRGEREADASAFADDKQRDLMARLENVRAALDAAGNDPAQVAARERYRLVSGAMTWQLAQDYSPRLWNATKTLRSVDAGLAEAQQRDAALAQAQKDEPARFGQFALRIAALKPRIVALIPRVATLSKEQQQVVQDLAVAELTRQKDRLDIYATQARFAVAQLYDRANLSKSADHATPQ